jgi:hypothetical protein
MIGLPRFERQPAAGGERPSCLGGGELGGKAEGLVRAGQVLERHAAALGHCALAIEIPRMVVLGTGLFDEFVAANGLAELAARGAGDLALADAFHRAPIPPSLVGDLRQLAETLRVPLAVRSSSQLEDRSGEPFAGVYGTKMVPSNEPDGAGRFRSLLDAVKFVWASTFFARARAYLAATRHRGEREHMAVVLQAVVGRRRGDRFYPAVSAVARSFNFYPAGDARPQDGVLDLALGLGKTIVEGELCWSVSLGRPRAGPPFASASETVERSQRRFWAVHVGPRPPYDPLAETEFLVRGELADAEADGALRSIASTYDPGSERILPGLGRIGPRVLDFAPILVHDEVPLVPTVRALLAACEDELGVPVEIELAMSLAPDSPPRLALLQLRPLLLADERVALSEADLAPERAWLASRLASGNGRRRCEDVVYVVPERFEPRHTPAIARELERVDRELAAAGRGYLLVGFGRWGSADPWLGVPVRWDQIAGAHAIVEAGLPGWTVEPSQGSHFFHNLSSFGVLYLALPPAAPLGELWQFLAGATTVTEGVYLRHVRLPQPLVIEVDGRTRRGVVRREGGR